METNVEAYRIINKNSIKLEELIIELKKQIIEVLNLEEVQPNDIDNEAPLFGEGLGLDSIDALELIVMMEKVYGIKIKDPSAGKEIFKSIKTMAEFISANRTK
jgi:acyl carrier protein